MFYKILRPEVPISTVKGPYKVVTSYVIGRY